VFTSTDFTDVRKARDIAISMAGKRCWRDNVFGKRFWRSIKSAAFKGSLTRRASLNVGKKRANSTGPPFSSAMGAT